MSSLCLSGYAYVDAAGTQVGIPSSHCFLPTDCETKISVGPTRQSVGPVTEEHGFLIPVPESDLDITCYS